MADFGETGIAEILESWSRTSSKTEYTRHAAVSSGGSAETVLDAIITVFDFTAREMEQYPRLMFEVIAYFAHATEPPHPPSLTRAERLLAFPDLPGAEDAKPQSIDELFTAQLKQAVRVGELPSSLSTEAVALLLKTVFYGVPLATRREGVRTIRSAYHQALEVLLGRWRTEEKSVQQY